MPADAHLLVQMTAIAVAVGILAQLVAERLRLPSIVFLLLFGVLLGPDVLGWIDTAIFGAGLPAIVTIAVALILFEGGLQLHYLDLAAVGRAVRNLVTVGAVVTVVGAALAAYLIVGFPLPLAFLFGAIVSVTGPTVINPLLDRVRVVRRVDTVLRGEGILIDPVGAILAVVILELLLTAEPSVLEGFLDFFFRMAVGSAMGLAGGWALGHALRLKGLVTHDLKNLVVLASVLAIFAAAQALGSESGLAAVVIAGMVVRQEAIPQQHLLRRFKGEISILFISVLFILLSAHLPLATLTSLGWGGVAVVLALMWILRPLNVLASTWNTNLSWRERLFVMWVAPRGVVAISIASFVAFLLNSGSVETARLGLTPAHGEMLLALVFLTIAITVIVQGSTAALVARLLSLRADDDRYVLIVGADPLGRTLGRLLADREWDPLLVDSNARHGAAARAMGLAAVHGNVLERDVLDRAQVESARALVATTSNQEINLLAAKIASEEYRVPNVYAVLAPLERGAPEALVEEMGGELAFGRRIEVDSWSDDLDRGRVREVEIQVNRKAPSEILGELPVPDDALPVLVIRFARAELCHSKTRVEPGDRILALVRNEGEQELARVLAGRPAAEPARAGRS